MSKKRKHIWVSILCAVFLLSVWVIFLKPAQYGSLPSRKSRILSAISQARAEMTIIRMNYGNYDEFSCLHQSMSQICQEIDLDYGIDDIARPVIVRDAMYNSQAACIYSPIPKKEYWCCADSIGHIGFTSIDPGSRGYCVEGESAICPPFPKEIN